MTTNDTFKYSRYLARFNAARYRNGNLALQIVAVKGGDYEGEPLCTVTVNPGFEIPDTQIAVKNWSENEGIDDLLTSLGVIGELVETIPSGFVSIPVFELTESGRELFDDAI